MEEYSEVACPMCFGTGYLNDEAESSCHYCCEEGMVSKEAYDDYVRRPIPTEYWWTKDGHMAQVDNSREGYYFDDPDYDE